METLSVGIRIIFGSGVETELFFLLPFSLMLLLLISVSAMRCSVASSRLSMAALRLVLGSLANELGFVRALARLSCLTRKAR